MRYSSECCVQLQALCAVYIAAAHIRAAYGISKYVEIYANFVTVAYGNYGISKA